MSDLLTIIPKLDTTDTNVSLTAQGLPSGEFLDPTTGVVSGTPLVSQTGTMQFTAAAKDGTVAGISIPYSLVLQDNGGNLPPDTGDIQQVSTLLDIVLKNLSGFPIHSTGAVQALLAYYRVIQIIIRDPANALLDLLTDHMRTYKNTIYREQVFMIGMASLPKEELLIVPVYTAFRQLTTTNQAVTNTQEVLRVTKCWPMVEYLRSYSQTVFPTPTPIMNPVTANTVAPRVYAYDGGTAIMYVGAAAYSVGITGTTTIVVKKDPNAIFPAYSFFTGSLVYVPVKNGAVTFDPSVKFSVKAAQMLSAVPPSGSFNLVLTINSFDNGETFVVTSLDVLE